LSLLNPKGQRRRRAASKDSPVHVALPAAYGRMAKSSSAHTDSHRHMTLLGVRANHQRDHQGEEKRRNQE
jgi:hypothetical protein